MNDIIFGLSLISLFGAITCLIRANIKHRIDRNVPMALSGFYDFGKSHHEIYTRQGIRLMKLYYLGSVLWLILMIVAVAMPK